MAGHVFISHGSENRDEADEICAFLESRGIKTWIAPRDVRPGMDYSEQLQSAIEDCLAFVVMVSDMANKSPYVRAETEMAFSNSKPIFPVRKSDIQPAAGLAFFLKIRHWTDAYGPRAQAGMDRLAEELRTLSGLSAEEAPPAPPPPSPPPPPPPPAGSQAPTGQSLPPAPPLVSAPAERTSPPAPAPAPATAEDEALLRTAIGPNADLYLDRFRAMDEKHSAMSWNNAACLANFFWFAYRKMWVWMAAIGFAVILAAVVGAANPVAGTVLTVLLLIATFPAGIFGNYLYRRQLRSTIASARAAGGDVAQTVAARGGASKIALIASIVTVALLVIVGIVLVAQQIERQKAANPAPVPAPAPAPSPPVNPVPTSGIDPALIPGRWTDTGDCTNALEYTADGRINAPDGSSGFWQLNGDQLTVSGSNGSQTVRITSIDQSAAYAVNPDGSVIASRRC